LLPIEHRRRYREEKTYAFVVKANYFVSGSGNSLKLESMGPKWQITL